ncbi:arylsulfatase [Lunatibacter salilacus]|uniref:arylsulfatase n=1 Tax=Lunatibacter salilacus TaxID=2483804 RepID=UPI00131E0DDA|nr:arylsulfatase [Lunatibacter salilacus]
MQHTFKYFLTFLLALFFFCSAALAQSTKSPNIILIITDDQGYGDLGFTGNPHVQTPVLDAMARESVRLNQFYVSPVCAPTRSSLMTGRYSLRTGMRDTYNGGAIMATEEITLAEMLKDAGYRTGIFGKWHLGDNYPFRPSDQGFDESVIHLAGGMGQPGDFTTFFQGDRSYFDPVLWNNNEQKSYGGYCSDIFTDEAIQFIETQKEQPFFCYLSFNAPHTPLQVPDEYYERYRDIDPALGLDNSGIPFAEMSEKDKEDARKVYAMVSNIDDNVGKLMKRLEELQIDDNTVVIFMTDNGPQQRRYNAGMRGLKGTVFRGGVRVPFFMKLPGGSPGGLDIDQTLAHIDVLPTLAEICRAKVPTDRVIDGRSFWPLVQGKSVDDLDNRSLFFYWTRKYPERYTNIALQKGDYKLVGNTGFDAGPSDFDLYDMTADEFELTNIVKDKPQVAKSLKKELDELLLELSQSPNLLKDQRIVIGSPEENPVFLNRNDAGGERGVWTQEDIFGLWKVAIEAGTYTVRFKFINPLSAQGTMTLETNGSIWQRKTSVPVEDMIVWENVQLPASESDLIPYFTGEGKRVFPLWVSLERID